MYKILKKIRKEKGYSIEDMAKIIETSPCNYFKKEMGKVKFSVNEAIIIAKFLKKKVESIFDTYKLSENETKKGD